MQDWNVIVTSLPGHFRFLLDGISRFGQFHSTEFKDVCVGRVENVHEFLDSVRDAYARGKRWVSHVGRIIPIENVFLFTPETLEQCLKGAVIPLVSRLSSGTFFVRLERRGYLGKIMSPEVEKNVASQVFDLAEQAGKVLKVSFSDPDYIIVAETVGAECGVGLIDRALRTEYPFVAVR